MVVHFEQWFNFFCGCNENPLCCSPFLTMFPHCTCHKRLTRERFRRKNWRREEQGSKEGKFRPPKSSLKKKRISLPSLLLLSSFPLFCASDPPSSFAFCRRTFFFLSSLQHISFFLTHKSSSLLLYIFLLINRENSKDLQKERGNSLLHYPSSLLVDSQLSLFLFPSSLFFFILITSLPFPSSRASLILTLSEVIYKLS